jgi:hypothetical protein
MRLQTDTVRLAVVLFISMMGCERSLDLNESTDAGDLSVTNVLHEPRLISPKDGSVFTTTSQILLRWGWVSTAKQYSVEVSTDTLFSRVLFSASAETTFVRTTPLDRTRFYWRVRAHNGRLASPWSEFRTFYVRFE